MIPHNRTAAARASVLAVVISMFAALLAAPQPAHAVPSPSQEHLNRAEMIAGIFDEYNRHRRAHGLAPLAFSPAISLRVTQPFSNTLAANGGGIWHNTSANITKGGRTWAENVALGPVRETAASLTQRWMDSPGHRTNMLNPAYTTVAIGVAHDDSGARAYSTVNLYKTPSNPGPTYASGAAWLASLNSSSGSDVNVYLTPGTHHVNGREWRTVCEPYSQTKRCRTEIWATQTHVENGQFRSQTTWQFNNLTYAPSPRSLWTTNPLGSYGIVGKGVTWTENGRRWRTECDTAVTGNGGCRSYTMATVVEPVGNSYQAVTREVFNNMVLFS